MHDTLDILFVLIIPMTKQQLLALIQTMRKSEKAVEAIDKAMLAYTDDQCGFWGDSIIRERIYEFIDSELWAHTSEMIYSYINNCEYVVYDWSKAEQRDDWTCYMYWGKESNLDKIEKIITNDEEFVDYIWIDKPTNIVENALSLWAWTIVFNPWDAVIKTNDKKVLDCDSIVVVDNWTTIRAFYKQEDDSELSPRSYVIVQWDNEETGVNATLVFKK